MYPSIRTITSRILSVLLVAALAAALLIPSILQNQKKTRSASDSTVRLEIWTFFDMNTPDSYYRSLWQKLAARHGWQVSLRTYSTQQIRDKLKIAAAGKELPDIFLVWGGTYPDYLFDSNACTTVQRYLETADFTFKDSYVRTYKGNNFIIPCLPEAYGVTYANTALMKKLHLSMPETWEELLDFVRSVNRYNQKHGTHYAAIELGDKDQWLGELLYCTIANRLDPEAYARLAAGDTAGSKALLKQAARMVQELADTGAFETNYTEIGEVESVENFIQGKALLLPHQSTIIYYLMKHMGQNSFRVHPFPSCADYAVSDGQSSSRESDSSASVTSDSFRSQILDINHTLTPGLCISSASDYQDEAADLCLEFAREVNRINVTKYGYLNMTTENLSLPEQLPAPVRQLHALTDHPEKVSPLMYAVLPSTAAEHWRSSTRKLLAGASEPEQFAKDAVSTLAAAEQTKGNYGSPGK